MDSVLELLSSSLIEDMVSATCAEAWELLLRYHVRLRSALSDREERRRRTEADRRPLL